ncbi:MULTISPECIES: hypothetical protein [unclassified Nocardiopsis]|uniref:hypothetical protein n=1 Tax=Nocardiopsis TaxID=2013 RepID=UPI00387B1D11
MTETDGRRLPRVRISTPARWYLGLGAALLLLVGAFVAYDRHQYTSGRAYGERQPVLEVHVFDGAHPGGDVSSHADLAEQECVEHGAADGRNAAAPRWVQGCVDAVLRR